MVHNHEEQVINMQKEEDLKLNEANNIVATMPKELLKSLFYVLTGKPDSMTKKFSGYVTIDKEALVDLNSQFREKLKQYPIDGITTTVTINYENHETKDFGSWQEFNTHRWTGPEVTDSIIIKWDFLARLPEYPVAQRHTSMVRISNGIGITELMQAISSGDIAEMSKLENNLAPIFCRVDFINAMMSSEILNLVEKWHKALKRPENKSSLLNKIKKYANEIANSIRYSVPMFLIVLMFGFGELISSQVQTNEYITIVELKYMIYWLAVTGIVFYIANKVAHIFAKKTYMSLTKYGEFHVFNMTNGDINEQNKMVENNKSYITSFIINFIIPLIINIVSGIITYNIFN